MKFIRYRHDKPVAKDNSMLTILAIILLVIACIVLVAPEIIIGGF